MSIELTGKLIQTLPQQSGTGKNGPWVKQDFIIETPGDFPKKICISVWGDKAKEVSAFKEGDEIKASVNIESREFNEKWYTDVKAWRLEKTAAGNARDDVDMIPPPAPGDVPPPSDDDLLPF